MNNIFRIPPLNKLPPHSYIFLPPQNKIPPISYTILTQLLAHFTPSDQITPNSDTLSHFSSHCSPLQPALKWQF